MQKWEGAAAVCVNDQGELLMVLQGTTEEAKRWSVPSGGRESGETLEACCLRELHEETGYSGDIIRALHEKNNSINGYDVTVQYFEVKVVGGKMTIQDPDELIYEIAWQSADKIEHLDLSFPEDRKFLMDYIHEQKISRTE